MITTSTVLVLGAGASMPYGFPSGGELVDRVLTDHPVLWRLVGIGHTEGEIEDFRRQLRASNAQSVDFFLERRPELAKIGKAAMAVVLAGLEQPSLVQKADGKDHWYRYLLHQLSATTPESFKRNSLKVITFNYDRSLEHFLFTSLGALYGLTEVQAQELVSSIPIVHVHGSLGSLVGNGGDGSRKYWHEFEDAWLDDVGELIQVVSEAGRDSDAYSVARVMLMEAQRVVFLGFGYHEQNMERLGFGDDTIEFAGEVMGSSYGLTILERDAVMKRWHVRLEGPGRVTLEYLRASVELD